MKLFLSFFLGLGIGVIGHALTNRWLLKRKKRGFRTGFQVRPSLPSTNRWGLKKRKRRFRPLPINLLIGTISVLLFSVLIYNAFRGRKPSGLKVSPPQKSVSPSPSDSASPAPIQKKSVASKPAALDTKGQRNLPEAFSEERRAPRRAEKVLSYPYSLKLGSFRTLKQAEKSITIYNKKGLSPYWVKVELKGKGVWYRVFTGHFAESEQAEKFRLEHRIAQSIVKKTRYANLIGVYTSRSELNNKMLSLKNLGYSPYVIKDPGGKSRLIVGAFLTKAGAEQLYDRLKSNRIQSQVIDR